MQTRVYYEVSANRMKGEEWWAEETEKAKFGEWHRCLNLKSHKTTCCLFFLDDGHSSLIDTENIRKMIADFTEAPSQVVCCTLPGNPKLKTDKEIQSKAVRYLKESMGQTIESVQVLKLMGDAYCLCLPEINKMLS